MGLFANPRLRLFLGAAMISLSPVWVRLVSVPLTTSGFYRVLFGGLALMIYIAATGKRLRFALKAWLILLLAAVFFALDLWFWHRSIFYVGPGLSTLLANFQVFILMFAGIIIARQLPRPMQIIAVPLALLGLGLIVGFDWRALPEDYRLGVIFGLLTAVAYAGYLLSLRVSHPASNERLPVGEIAMISLATAAILGVTVIAEGASFAIPTWTDAGWLIAYGVLSHCLGYLFIASSLPFVSPTEAGLGLLLQPTLAFIWDVLMFGRVTTATEYLGLAIALFAIYLGSRSPSEQS